MSSDDARVKLLAHFSNPDGNPNDKWSELWDAGDFLPWDRGSPSPALEDILKDHKDLIGSPSVQSEGTSNTTGGRSKRRRKRALVPGCGRGYDVLLLASFGYDAYGLDVSETAVEQCRAFAQQSAQDYPPRTDEEDGEGGVGKVAFVVGDFLKDNWIHEVFGAAEAGAGAEDVEVGRKFDLIYDYTFLSIFPPDMRPAWSLRCSQLLSAKPEGHLICLEFPTYKPPSTKGPPYGLPPKVYLAHLSHPGKKLAYDESDDLLESEVPQNGSGGLERLAHWQPKRTHEIGQGTDWVSIWRHRQ